MPYGGDSALYTEKGRVDRDHAQACYDPEEHDASDYFRRVGEYVDEYVEAFLTGEIEDEKNIEPINTTYELVNGRVMTAAPMIHFYRTLHQTEELKQAMHMELFWKASYPHTGTVKTNKAMAAQLAHQMRTGVHGKRPRAAALRARMKLLFEDFLLDGSGFAISYKS
jgi:hypothetical protein